jgi:predicted Fe-Mo cluster-binding NifX family protein
MRIAVTVWNDRISPLMDTARQYWLVESDTPSEVRALRTEVFFEDECYLYRRCLRLRALGVDVVICGAISRDFSTLLQKTEIEVIDGISGPAEEVLQAYLDGRLSEGKYHLPGRKGSSRDGSSFSQP